MTDETRPGVKQLRLVVEAEDYEEALAFYRDVLGLHERESHEGEGDARVTILDVGRATLELSNPAQVRMIDRVEADGAPSARLRVAFEVEDAASVTDDLVAGGARLIAAPRETPWRSLNSRLDAPAGLQVTLFQELDDPAPRDDAPDSESPFEGHA
jgi:catechol 2,3-dioxygenase-like lactoylglutathione lyase family enzyme